MPFFLPVPLLRVGGGSGSGGNPDVPLTISGNTSNYNIYIAAGSPTTPVDVTLTINSGILVGSSSTANPALRTGSGWHASSTLRIVNLGKASGKIGANGAGGPGGDGGAPPSANGFAGATGGIGETGGTSFLAEFAVTVDNGSGILEGGSGGIGGGGGGGGGGSCGCAGCHGGRGGDGVTNAGKNTGLNSPPCGGIPSGQGGDGGAVGQPGTAGQTTLGSGAAGGAAGANGLLGNSVEGNSFITWEAFGTRTGPVV